MNETVREAFYCSKCHCNTTRFINSGKTLCQKCLLKDEARRDFNDKLKEEADKIAFEVTCYNCDPQELGFKPKGKCPLCNNTRLYKMIPYDNLFTNLKLREKEVK